jgi:hypothetical protein
MKCPGCSRPVELATKHCPSPTCTWLKCKCGVRYSKLTGDGYAETPAAHYPAKKPDTTT